MKNKRAFASFALLCMAAISSVVLSGERTSLSLIIMDPLAAPLSCPCVEGYAQRDYGVLAKLLEQELDVEIKLAFASSLDAGVKKAGGADIVIGKQSVVEADLREADRKAKPVYRLSDATGSTDQHGLIVVNRDDPAESVADLSDYTIIFGAQSANEKHAAALELLSKANINVPEKLRKIDEACSDGACKVIDLGAQSKTAAVISSYAQPLLEGCGTIKKGDLRVVGKTKAVPFVTMFLSDRLNERQRAGIESAIKMIPEQPHVLEALESLIGFLDIVQDSGEGSTRIDAKKKPRPTATQAG